MSFICFIIFSLGCQATKSPKESIADHNTEHTSDKKTNASDGETMKKHHNTNISLNNQHVYIGNPIQNIDRSTVKPASYCLEDGNQYKGAPFRIGDTNIFYQGLSNFDSSKTVLIYGEPIASLKTALTLIGKCPEDFMQPIEIQLRSDWLPPEGGHLTTTETLRTIPAFRGESHQDISFLTTTNNQGTIELHFTNPFAHDMSTLSYVAHYEGGYGKPVPNRVAFTINLKAGQNTTFPVDEVITENSKPSLGIAKYQLKYIEIMGTIEKATFDVRISIPSQGNTKP